MDTPKLQVFESRPLRYVITVPPTRPQGTRRHPVLCFLHGRGEVAPMDICKAVTTYGPLRRGSSSRATECFIVVAPQLPSQPQPLRDPKVWSKYERDVEDVVREVREKYNGDPQRTYLTGFSYGGNGTLNFASDQRD